MRKFCTLVFFLLLLICCAPQNKPISGGALRLPFYSSIVGLDPVEDCSFHSSVVILDLIYSPLYINPPDSNDLLDSVKTNDAKIWFLKLKPGLHFQDDPCFEQGKGRFINSQDIEYAFSRSSANLVGPDNYSFRNILKITILDSLNVKVELKQPDPNFVSLLSAPRFRVVPKEAIEKYGENIRFHPVGNGPFKLAAWDDEKLTLIRNKNFWIKSLPYLDELILYPSKNPLNTYNEFQRGNLDASPIPASLLPEMVEYDQKSVLFKLKAAYFKKRMKILTGEKLDLGYCVFYRIKNPLVRQAFNYAVNRTRLVKDRPNLFPASGSLSRPLSPGFSYDPEKAKSLLAQAGQESLKELEKPLLFKATPSVLPTAEFIKDDLQKIGVKVEVRPSSWIGYQDRESDMDIGVFTLLGQDPVNQLSFYQEPSFLVLSEKTTSLCRQLLKESLKERQDILIRKLEAEILQDPPLIFLYWSKNLLLVRDYVMNADPDKYGVSPELWIKK